MKNLLFLSLFALLGASVSASVETGTPAPDFTLLDTDGNEVALADFSGKFVVLEWLNHGCPFVKRHYDSGNMQALQEKYTEAGVVWLSIVSSAPGAQGHDSAAGHNKTAEAKSSASVAILLDESGEVGMLYDAKTTPHMYVINPEGVLIYQGAIDDAPRGGKPGEVNNYVSAALDSAMAGEDVVVTDTRPYGCSVKYAK